MTIRLPVIHCSKCLHEWVPRKEPTMCPVCKRKKTWKKGKAPTNGELKSKKLTAAKAH